MTGGRLSFVITDGECACRVKKEQAFLSTNVKSAVSYKMLNAESQVWFDASRTNVLVLAGNTFNSVSVQHHYACNCFI